MEKEMLARSRENLLLWQQLQELTDIAGGLTVTMAREWSLEEQNTAWRLSVRTAMENLDGEFKQLELGEKSFTWGLGLAALRHVRPYEGVTKVRVEGDMAMVQFINMDWATMCRGDGGTPWFMDVGWRWGR